MQVVCFYCLERQFLLGEIEHNFNLILKGSIYFMISPPQAKLVEKLQALTVSHRPSVNNRRRSIESNVEYIGIENRINTARVWEIPLYQIIALGNRKYFYRGRSAFFL